MSWYRFCPVMGFRTSRRNGLVLVNLELQGFEDLTHAQRVEKRQFQ